MGDEAEQTDESAAGSACVSAGLAQADFFWIAAFWIAAGLFYFPVLFGKQSFYFRDVLAYYYPYACMTVDALGHGRLPHWEPRICTGYPFQADPHSLSFYPLVPLLLMLPMPRAYDVFTVVHAPLAATFLYLLLRRWQLSRGASALGAVVSMFSGFDVSITCILSLQRALVWTAAALYCFEGFLIRQSWRALIATALVLAVEGSGCDPMYLLLTIGFLAIAPWLRPVAGDGCGRRGPAGALLAACLAGLFLAYQYLPLAQLFLLSDRTAGLAGSERTLQDIDPANLFGLLLPMSFPEPGSLFYRGNFHGGRVSYYPDLYLGLGVLALAAASLGWLVPSKRLGAGEDAVGAERGRSSLLAISISLLALLIALGHHAPFFDWFTTALPFMRVFRFPGKYLFLAGFAFPLAAALGFEGLRVGGRRCVAAFSMAVTAAAVGLAWALVKLSSAGVEIARAFLSGGHEGLTEQTELLEAVARGWKTNSFFVMALAVTFLALVGLAARRKMPWRFAWTAIGLMALGDLAAATIQSLPLADDALLAEKPQAAERFAPREPGKAPTRYMNLGVLTFPTSLDWTVKHNYVYKRELLRNLGGVPFGLNPLDEMISVRLVCQVQLLQAIGEAGAEVQEPLAAAAGVQYTLRSEPGGKVRCRQVSGVPRAFVAKRAWLTGSPVNCAPEILMRLPNDVAFERPLESAASQEILEPAQITSCVLARYESDSLRVSFALAGKGLLVVEDALYPGWKAAVDGQERPIRPVDGVFRGVEVSQGEHTLEMWYVPAAFRVGLCISLIALAAALGGLALLARERQGKQNP
ncbi:MAG: YfhO family protein [Candidatus Wallbacteria bacterium]|nr:YfhO family protein [Candidatus Wallbacteria bacterium]